MPPRTRTPPEPARRSTPKPKGQPKPSARTKTRASSPGTRKPAKKAAAPKRPPAPKRSLARKAKPAPAPSAPPSPPELGEAQAIGFDAAAATAHLVANDARLAAIIAKVGPLAIPIAEAASPFEALARSIIYQQLHGKAAAAIHARLVALFPERRLDPQALLAATDDALRSAGLSRTKMLALRDLAAHAQRGTVPTAEELVCMSDEAIIERIVQVRGIGRWTVEMLLIFRLGRPDVLPVHDYGVRYGFQVTYGKRAMPTPKELARAGEKWRPFRTAAAWYFWRAAEMKKKAKT